MNSKLMENKPNEKAETKPPLTTHEALVDLRHTFRHNSDNISYVGEALGMLGLHDASTKIEASLNAIEEKINLLEQAYHNDLSRQIQTNNEHTANMLNAAMAGIKIAKGKAKYE